MIRKIFYLHEQGKRENVEDNIYPSPGNAVHQDRVFLVCDGVGGEAKGEVASQIVCEIMGEKLSKMRAFSEAAILQCGQEAIQELKYYATRHPEAKRISTTVTIACIDENGIWTGWCGDSRIYHIRNGSVLWKSKDHSFVQSLVNLGQLTEEEAKHHEKRNLILRSFSAQSNDAALEFHQLTDVQPGDYLLMCTDGLLEQITEGLLYQILQENKNDSDKAALINKYCKGNTSDNYSMYLLELNDGSGLTNKNKNAAKNAGLLRNLLLGVMGIAALTLSYFFLVPLSDKDAEQSINQKDTAIKREDAPVVLPHIEHPLPKEASALDKKPSKMRDAVKDSAKHQKRFPQKKENPVNAGAEIRDSL